MTKNLWFFSGTRRVSPPQSNGLRDEAEASLTPRETIETAQEILSAKECEELGISMPKGKGKER